MLAALFLLTLCFSVPHRVRSESIGWYFKPAKDNVQPQCCPEASGFAKENGAIYLGNPDEKKIYLTFDAGYENGNVESSRSLFYSAADSKGKYGTCKENEGRRTPCMQSYKVAQEHERSYGF